METLKGKQYSENEWWQKMKTLKRKNYNEWSEKEEEALVAGVAKYGVSNWKRIRQDSQFSLSLCRKSCDDLGNKWRNLTDRGSEKKKLKMSPELSKVLDAHIDSKKKTAIVKKAQKLVESGIKGSPWTDEEEEALAAGVVKHGLHNWVAILEDPEFGPNLTLHSSKSMASKWRNLTARVSEEKLRRMSHKVRKVVNAYMRDKYTSINDDEAVEEDIIEIRGMGDCWTKEEEESLAAGVAKHGEGRWKNILKDEEYFGPVLAPYSCYSLAKKWRCLSMRGSGAKLTTMPSLVSNVVDDPAKEMKETERNQRISEMEEDPADTLMMDVPSSSDFAEAVEKTARGLKLTEDGETLKMDQSSIEATKETAKIFKTAEDAKSMLLLLREICEKFC